jgi:hypothetical protein
MNHEILEARSTHDEIVRKYDRIASVYDLEIYKLTPPFLAGCRGIRVKSFLEATGFGEIQRTFVSQLGFPSEVVRAAKLNGEG